MAKSLLGGPFGPLVLRMLDGSLWIVFGAGRFIGWIYAKIWPALGLGFYDQRYVCARGPQSWRWTERGMFAYMAGKPGGAMLDLCCGDGIYPGLFLRELNGSIDAIDRDVRTIEMARRRYRAPDLRFYAADVVNDPFPRGAYDMVTCFASLQYFGAAQTDELLLKIAEAIRERDGVFAGSVPIFAPPRGPDPAAIHNFASESELRDMLSQHFQHIETWHSLWSPGLTHCYFKCKAR